MNGQKTLERSIRPQRKELPPRPPMESGEELVIGEGLTSRDPNFELSKPARSNGERVQGEFESMLENYRILEEELERCKEALARQTRELDESRETLSSRSKELVEAREALADQKERTRELRAEWNEAVSKIVKLQPRNTPAVSDEYLRDLWTGLDYAIKNWAINHFTVHRKPSVVKGGLNPPPELCKMCHDFEQCYQSQTLRPLIIRAAVWNLLRTKVFQQAIWAGRVPGAAKNEPTVTRAFCTIKEAVEPKQNLPDLVQRNKEFHNWRALTSTIVVQNSPTENRRLAVGDLKSAWVKLLRPYSTSSTQPDFEGDLELIILKCVDLDAHFYQSKAYYIVLSPYPHGIRGYPFDSGSMESLDQFDTDMTNKTTVMLTLSPMVIKAGTSEGDNYQTRVPLVRSQVVCKESWSHCLANDEADRKKKKKEEQQQQQQQQQQLQSRRYAFGQIGA